MMIIRNRTEADHVPSVRAEPTLDDQPEAPRPSAAGGLLMPGRLTVDADRCMGHGQCYVAAPGLLSDDDEGFVTLRGQSMEVPADLLLQARRAVAACPERAVTLAES
jgi:ferredoxin